MTERFIQPDHFHSVSRLPSENGEEDCGSEKLDGNQFITKAQGQSVRIYRIETTVFPHLSAYVYLAMGERFAPVLIDAGSGELDSPQEILSGLERIAPDFGERFAPTDVQTILLTHAHIDHFGGANELSRRLGASVACHRFDSRIIESFSERASVANARYGTFLAEMGVESERIDPVLRGFGFLPGRVRSTPVDRTLDEGDEFGPFRVHYFPGHSAGAIALEIGDFLISGDLLLAKTLTQIWPERIMPQTGLIRYLESIEKLRTLLETRQNQRRPLILLPGHEASIQDPLKRIELVVQSTMRRNDRLLAILKRSDSAMTGFELSRRLYLTTHMSRTFFALADTAARLEYLQLHGRLAADNYDDLAAGTTQAVRYVARR